ncbi:MAG: hypothetical protein EZS28_027951, partial [Streblomastix strix]
MSGLTTGDPAEKIDDEQKVAILLRGGQGCGKNSFTYLLSELLSGYSLANVDSLTDVTDPIHLEQDDRRYLFKVGQIYDVSSQYGPDSIKQGNFGLQIHKNCETIRQMHMKQNIRFFKLKEDKIVELEFFFDNFSLPECYKQHPGNVLMLLRSIAPPLYYETAILGRRDWMLPRAVHPYGSAIQKQRKQEWTQIRTIQKMRVSTGAEDLKMRVPQLGCLVHSRHFIP